MYIYELKHLGHAYLQIMTDFHADFGQRDGHCGFLQLAQPGVQLVPCQKLLQPVQGLHMVGHDEDHTGLLVGQRHVEHVKLVVFVIVVVIKTCVKANISFILFLVDMKMAF